MKIRVVTVWENLVYSYKCSAKYIKFHYNSLSYVHAYAYTSHTMINAYIAIG